MPAPTITTETFIATERHANGELIAEYRIERIRKGDSIVSESVRDGNGRAVDADKARALIAGIGDHITCPRCRKAYRYHGLIVCDSCHAAGNRELGL
jgi:hypothetical protein